MLDCKTVGTITGGWQIKEKKNMSGERQWRQRLHHRGHCVVWRVITWCVAAFTVTTSQQRSYYWRFWHLYTVQCVHAWCDVTPVFFFVKLYSKFLHWSLSPVHLTLDFNRQDLKQILIKHKKRNSWMLCGAKIHSMILFKAFIRYDSQYKLWSDSYYRTWASASQTQLHNTTNTTACAP